MVESVRATTAALTEWEAKVGLASLTNAPSSMSPSVLTGLYLLTSIVYRCWEKRKCLGEKESASLDEIEILLLGQGVETIGGCTLGFTLIRDILTIFTNPRSRKIDPSESVGEIYDGLLTYRALDVKDDGPLDRHLILPRLIDNCRMWSVHW